MNNLSEKSLQLLTITLRRTALYGFSNMQTYVRPWRCYSLTLHSYNDKKWSAYAWKIMRLLNYSCAETMYTYETLMCLYVDISPLFHLGLAWKVRHWSARWNVLLRPDNFRFPKLCTRISTDWLKEEQTTTNCTTEFHNNLNQNCLQFNP